MLTGFILYGAACFLLQAGFGFAASCAFGEAPWYPKTAPESTGSRIALHTASPSVFFTVNTSSREEVRKFFNAVYTDSENVDPQWTGDVANCIAGSVSDRFAEAVALRINWVRALAGVPAWVTLDPVYCQKAQKAALMISANNNASHTPPPTWQCYSLDGAEACGNSNLSIGSYGPDAIIRYIEDFGPFNYAVGHRRWLLYPNTRLMGTGDIPHNEHGPAANAVWIIDPYLSQPRPTTREPYVAWPPPGYVPYQVVFARWSFSYPKADFSATKVTMTSNSIPVSVTVEPVEIARGENTVVWFMTGLDTTWMMRWPCPSSDVNFTVSVTDVLVNGVKTNFQYTVTVFDPNRAGPDTVLPEITGPASPAVGAANIYSFRQVQGATGYQWIAARRAPWTIVEDAEIDRGDFVVKTSPGYQVRMQFPGSGGSRAWHLAHTFPEDQWLQYKRIVLPGPATVLQYKSILRWATAAQEAHVQVSTDNAKTWVDVDLQVGNDSGNAQFQTRSVSLANYANRPLLLRFLYHYADGDYYPQPDTGWYLDDITIVDGEELTIAASGEIDTGNTFQFTPTQAGDWALAIRSRVFGNYWFEWGPAKRVSASNTPIVMFSRPPEFSGNNVVLRFSVVNAQSGMKFRLERTATLTAGWATDTSAKLEEVLPGTEYKFTTPKLTGASGFYRIVGD